MQWIRQAIVSPGVRRAGRIALRLTGPALLLILLVRVVDYGELRDAVAGIEVGWALGALAMVQAMVILRTFRWIDIHEAVKLPPAPMSYQLRLSYATNFATLVVPQIVSPLSRLALMLQDGYRAQRVAVGSVAEKGLDLVAFLGFGLYGSVYLASVFGGLVWWASGIAILVLGLALAAYAGRERLGRTAAVVVERLPGASSISGEDGSSLMSEFEALGTRLLARLIGWSFLVALAQATILYLLSRSLGIDLSYQFLVATWGVIALTMMLPLSVGGVGTREAVLVVAFNSVDRSTDAAIALGLLVWAVVLVGSLPGAVEWMVRFVVGSGGVAQEDTPSGATAPAAQPHGERGP